MWDAFQGIGALFGIGSALFLSYQHLVRFTPTAYFISNDVLADALRGTRKRARLRIVNRSERPILVRWPAGMKLNLIRILSDESTRAILVSLIHDENTVCLSGNATHEFDISTPNNFADLDPDNQLYTDLTWRYVQPMVCKWDRKISLIITKADFEALENHGEISRATPYEIRS